MSCKVEYKGKVYDSIEELKSYMINNASYSNEYGIEDFDDITPEYRKFDDLTSTIETQIREMNRRIGVLATDVKSETNTKEDKIQALKVIKVLKDRKDALEQSLSQSKKLNSPYQLAEFAEGHLAEAERILNKDEVNPSESVYVTSLLNLWLAAGRSNFENNDKHIFLTDEELKNEKFFTGDGEFKGFFHYQNQASLLKDKVNKINKKITVDYIRKFYTGTLTDDQLFEAIQDAFALSALTLDLGRQGDPMLEAIFLGMKSKIKQANLEYDRKVKQLTRLIKTALPELKKFSNTNNAYELLLQKNSNGQYTGGLTNVYTQDFYDMRSALREASFKSNTKNKQYREWKKDNLIIMDVRLLFPDTSIYSRQNYPESMRQDHINELKSHMGEEMYNQQYARLEKKLERFKLDYDYHKLMLTEEEFELWNQKNSPYWYARLINDESVLKDKDGKIIKLEGWKHTIEVARRFDTKGKETGWYDKDFETIQSNAAIKELFDFFYTNMIQMRNYLPPHATEGMSINTIPDLESGFLEELAHSGMNAAALGMNRVYDDLKGIARSTDNLQVLNMPIDPESKQVKKFVNAPVPSSLQRKANTLLDIEKAKYLAQTGKNMPAKIAVEKRKEIIDTLVRDPKRSLDLEKVMRGYISAATLYKHKSSIQDELNIVENSFMKRTEQQTNSISEPVKDMYGRLVNNANNLSNYKALLQHQLNHFRNLPTNEDFGQTDRKAFTSEEKKLKEAIEETLSELSESFKNGKIDEIEYNYQKQFLEEELKTLGGNITGSGLLDVMLRYIHLKGMGWNLFSAFSNMGFGMISNLIEASDGRLFNQQELFKALNITKGSVFKNLTFNGYQSEDAIKIRSIMDKYNFLKTSKDEIYRSELHNAFEKAKFLSPYSLTDRSEYFNQAPVVVAMMLHRKIKDLQGNERSLWDAFDKDGEFKIDEFGENFLSEQKGGGHSDEVAFTIAIDRAISKIHGNYDPDALLLLKKNAFGRMLSQFRTWLFEAVASRFESESWDSSLGIARKGRYRSLVSAFSQTETNAGGFDTGIFMIKQLFRKLASAIPFVNLPTEFDKRFSEVDAANLRALLQELVIYGSLVGLAALVKGLTGDDDDDYFLANQLINQLNRLQSDIGMYYNPIIWKKTVLMDPIVGTKVIDDLVRLVSSMGTFIVGEDMIEHGHYAGQSKLLRGTVRMLPAAGQVQKFIDSGTQVW